MAPPFSSGKRRIGFVQDTSIPIDRLNGRGSILWFVRHKGCIDTLGMPLSITEVDQQCRRDGSRKGNQSQTTTLQES